MRLGALAGWFAVGTAATAVLGAAAGQGTLQAKAPALPSNEQLRRFRVVRDVRLSPDGRSVLAVIADSTAEGGRSHVWLIDVNGGEPRQLTFSGAESKPENGGERAAEWMPDGESVLFLAHRGEHTSLYQLPMRGGEAKELELKVLPKVDRSKRADAIPLDKLAEGSGAKGQAEDVKADGAKADGKKADDTKAEPVAIDVEAYRIAPDGKHIAVIASDPQTPGEKRQKDAKADAEWVDHDPHAARLYLLDVGANEAWGMLPARAGQAEVRGCAGSPDSTWVVVLSEAPNGQGDLRPSMSASVVNASTPSQTEPLRNLPPTIGAAEWSRDGRHVVYLAQSKQDAPPGVSDLYDYSLLEKTSTDRSGKLAGTLGREGPLTLESGEVDQLMESGVDTVLARIVPGQGDPLILRLPVHTMVSFGTNEQRNGWVFVGNDGGHATTLFYAAQQGDVPHALKLPPLVPDGLRTIAPKRIRWKSDGFTIEALLYLPQEAATRRVPLVVEAHGGPTQVFGDQFAPFAQFLLGQGWAVLQPNPRGSTGYRTAFAAANKNDLGGGDFRDIMAGVDFVLKTEPVDGDRMALIGYSYGGEMAGFAESRTDRFKAIVSAAPVIDQFSEYGTEKDSWYDRWFYGLPWDHHEDAWRQSPLAGIARATSSKGSALRVKTPFLLIQGESDTTDPLGQSQEMYRALRQVGVPVDLVTYPREDHGPLANGIYGGASREPWHGYDARRRIVEFVRAGFERSGK